MIKEVKHLKYKGSRDFFNKICNDFTLEDHNKKILILACETLDKIEEAQRRLKKEGSYYISRFGEPRSHPALKEVKDNKALFLKLIKQLELDFEESNGVGRPPEYSIKKRRKTKRKKLSKEDNAYEKMLNGYDDDLDKYY